MSQKWTIERQYETGFDQPTDSDAVVYKTVCRKYTRWVVDGRILERGDPAETESQPVFLFRDRLKLLSLSVS